MASETKLDIKPVLDGLGQGVLLFNSKGDLLMENLAARTILGKDINLIRSNGWDAVSALFNTRQTNPETMIEAIRDRALQSERPIRFSVYLAGEYLPCWASAVQGGEGDINVMLTLDVPDWTAMSDLVERFRDAMKEAVASTQGHVELIDQMIAHHDPKKGTEALAKRITGFTRLIAIHMDRVGRLMAMLERLEDIRTGALNEKIRARRRKIDLENFIEDFVEEIDEITLVDPETDARDHRSRLKVDVPSGLAVTASSSHLTTVLRDLLRNAIMYSIKATPIKLTVQQKDQNIQVDLTDEGYGIRERERERIFEAFQRARQPQIIAEFGYGLSMYLCKHEVEAMNGRLWFESEEGVGTTLSIMLPVWREEPVATVSSSDSETAAP